MPEQVQQPAPQPQVTTSQGTNWKKISLILIVVMFLISLVGVGIYLLIPRPTEKPTPTTQPQKIVTPSAKKDETADWKTYTSTRDGYSIKYPQDWIVIPEKANDGPYIRNFEPEPGPYPQGYINLRIIRIGPQIYDNLSALEWYGSLKKNGETEFNSHYVMSTLENINFNGLEAKRVKASFSEIDEEILVPHGEYVFEIIIYPFGGSEDKIAKLILSTFKFLD